VRREERGGIGLRPEGHVPVTVWLEEPTKEAVGGTTKEAVKSIFLLLTASKERPFIPVY